ncbi:MAG TPA: hypothetical protein VG797_00750 [Phycisphaerales bacterium]|nr:hypothetical protein [Phycisphaerales bacterium]
MPDQLERSPLGFAQPTAIDRGERRIARRLPFNKVVAAAFFDQRDSLTRPVRLIAEDISSAGIRLAGPQRFTKGSFGVVQLDRDDGSFGLVGVTVVHTQAIDAMIHVAGAQFVSLPDRLAAERFIRPDGRLLALDRLPMSA